MLYVIHQMVSQSSQHLSGDSHNQFKQNNQGNGILLFSK